MFRAPLRNRWFADSLLEGTGFEPSVPPRKRRPWREAPRPTIVVSRDDLCLMAPSNLSVRRPLRQQPRDLFGRAGPMVRIRFPPATSQANSSCAIGSPEACAYAQIESNIGVVFDRSSTVAA